MGTSPLFKGRQFAADVVLMLRNSCESVASLSTIPRSSGGPGGMPPNWTSSVLGDETRHYNARA
jgi:hypothetical protein